MTTPSSGRASEPMSQTDIDRMLGGQGSDLPREPRGLGDDIQAYDFRRPHRVSAERLRTLEAMYGRLVKSLEGWLMGRVRGVIDLRLQSVEQISFGEFVLSLPTNCNSFIVDVKDTDGDQALGEQCVIDIGRELAFFLVDRLFGGGADATVFDRPLTPIERLAIRVVGEKLMMMVSEIWHDHVALDMSIAGFESIRDIIQAAPREAPALVANIDAEFAGMSSLISISLPLSVLETFFVTAGGRPLSSATFRVRENPAQRVATEATLRATRIDVGARLPEFRLAMRDIAGLRVGSLLSTGIPVESHVNLLVGSQARFKTAPGRVGKKLAVRVLDSIMMPSSYSPDDSQ
ncbi:MAG TPA: FliM/FliN family flagellar motor switch protein [Gemmatimonadaceae bacterium]|nr:FliM/FliN family flagellar motor switch protein [Gemmatimonadaceae bacterium]